MTGIDVCCYFVAVVEVFD